MSEGVSIVILCKPLKLAKRRLAPILDAQERAAFAAAMLSDVLDAACGARMVRRIAVRSADAGVGKIALAKGAEWQFEEATQGLNAAASAARASACQSGERSLMLLSADLPLATGADIDRLAELGTHAGARAHDGGTNALLLDPACPFQFLYGPNSFSAHAAALAAQGETLRCLLSGGLVEDIDTPPAVARLLNKRVGAATRAFLGELPHLREQVA
ncbi:MAG: 2-phospho-L-lactate guanylyltransferase [Erythrobacter sp.]